MIVFPEPEKSPHLEAFTIRMLGLPTYNGSFDFSKKKLDIPRPFPPRRSSIDLKSLTKICLIEKIDNSSVIYTSDRLLFNVVGRHNYSFHIEEVCNRLATGNGRAYILTDRHMYVCGGDNVEVFLLSALDITTSPFNEIFVLTHNEILIFGKDGLKEVFPYQGKVRFIHFYLFRELLLVGETQVFHLNLNKQTVDVIHTACTRILSTVFRDRLYMLEVYRFTSLNVEEGTSEAIHIERQMKFSVGDTMVALYLGSGEFLFCDRLNISNNEGIAYDISGLVGFFFVRDKGCFLFRDRIVTWDMGDVQVVRLNEEEMVDYMVEFPDTLDMLRKEYEARESRTATLRPNGVHEGLVRIVQSIFKKKKAAVAHGSGRRKVKYTDRRGGGF